MQPKLSRLSASILLIAGGGIVAAVGVAMASPGHVNRSLAVLGIDFAIIILAIVFERYRYRPNIDKSQLGWEPTDERYVDPGSGQTMRVWFNPKSGQRDYRPDTK